jgi:hypothetical protein
MDNMKSSRLSLFLMELIIAIFFFSLSAGVCVRLFVSAHTLSERTENLENAVMWTQNLSEAFVAKKGDLKAIAKLFPDGFVSETSTGESGKEGNIILIFDDRWELMENTLSDASYEVIMSTALKDASEVYNDVNTYGELRGKAAAGGIAVYDLRGTSDILTNINENADNAFHFITVDVYVGEED